MSKRDYYEALGVEKTATADEIKKSFRKKARELHPDVNKAPDAEAQFKEIGEAYEVLSDEQKRQVYDTYGHDGLQGSGYQPSWNFTDSFPDLNDLFSSFFGGNFGFGGGQRQAGGPQQGEHLRYDMRLGFMDAAFGAEREIEVSHYVGCNPCNGTGASPESGGPVVCQTCQGQGQVQSVTQTLLGNFMQITTCPTCRGAGKTIKDPCKNCGGQGRLQEKKNLTITIPAGVDTGTRLRVSSEGDAGYLGGPPGDLYVIMHVEQHPQFQRDGVEVFTQLKVSYPQLVLGDTIEVQLLQGTHQLKIPPSTENGHMFTIRNEGIVHLNNNKHRGNFHVQVILDIPKHPSKEEKQLLEQLLKHQKGADKITSKDSPKENKKPNNKGGLFNKFKPIFTH